MAEKKGQTIVIKRINKGHGGAHGGAWKVAFADFMTAMMAFFLVMWLMGSDEETKSAVSHYFNHPNTPYKGGRDPASDVTRPMGEMAGQGEDITPGMAGAMPDDLVKNPVRPEVTDLKANKEIAELVQELLDHKAFAMDINIDYLKFSVPENLLFKENSTELAKDANKHLDRLGQVFRGYQGYIKVEGHADKENSYEFSMSRAVTVMNYFVKNRWVSEDKLFPVGSGSRRAIASSDTQEGREKNRRIDFIVSRKPSF